MSAYDSMAPFYDALTSDVPYEDFLALYEAEFSRRGLCASSVLDLACGTGTMTCLLSKRGYDTIGVDLSSEMLSMSREKAEELDLPNTPLFLCQDITRLDLYGTVDAAVCCLDGLNYISQDKLPLVFGRLRLFIRPGGVLIFDLLSPERLKALDGSLFADEAEDVLCLWRGVFNSGNSSLSYDVDLFIRQGSLWRRETEEHVEYARETETVLELLDKSGFADARVIDGPESDQGRVFFSAVRR